METSLKKSIWILHLVFLFPTTTVFVKYKDLFVDFDKLAPNGMQSYLNYYFQIIMFYLLLITLYS